MDMLETTSAKRRCETFCDGLLAVVLVSAALQVRLPDGPPLRTMVDVLYAVGAPVAAYLLNFYTVAILWSNQRKLTRSLPDVPPSVVAVMLAVLAIVSLSPLAVRLLVADPLSSVAIQVFSLLWAVVALGMTASRLMLVRMFPGNRDLAALLGMVTYRGVAAVLLYAGAIPLAQVSPVAALVAVVLAPSLFLIRDGASR